MVHIKRALTVGGGDPVVYNSTDTIINLSTSDLNKVHVIENAAAVVVNLPSVGSSDVKAWVEFRKKGAGNLTINRGGTNTVVGLTSISNTVPAQTFAYVRLIVETATNWGRQGALGNWTTA